MNTKLNEMNQRFEKNEMAEKENMQARRDYYVKYREWKDKVERLNPKDQNKEIELEKELGKLFTLEKSIQFETQEIKKEKRELQEYFESIPGPKYGDYDLKNSYLTLDWKKESGTLLPSQDDRYLFMVQRFYTLKPLENFHNPSHDLLRMISYLFSKGFKEFVMAFSKDRNLYFNHCCCERIHPGMSEKEWKRISDLMVDSEFFSIGSTIKYRNILILIEISNKGELMVGSHSEIDFDFNEILEHMEEVSYENILN